MSTTSSTPESFSGVNIDKNLTKLYKLANNYTMDSKKKKARLVTWTEKITTPIDTYLSNTESKFSSPHSMNNFSHLAII